MLLIFDVSNRYTSIAAVSSDQTRYWSIATSPHRAADDYGLVLSSLLSVVPDQPIEFEGAIIGSVVPGITGPLSEACQRYLGVSPMIVGPGVRTGVRIRTDNPREVGADRIANVLAAQRRLGSPVIVVDFGTPTTFDVVGPDGAYLGSAIAPGLEMSLEALTEHAAQLHSVPLVAPSSPIGPNTTSAIQSGLIFGMAGLIDGMVERIRHTLGERAPVIATGRHAELLLSHAESLTEVDANLTIEGLRQIWLLNNGSRA